MMIAQLAPTLGGGAGPPAWLPDGATSHVAFQIGAAYAGGEVLSIADVLGGGYNPAELSASGLLFNFPDGNLPKAIGPLLSDLAAGLAAGCTIVFDMEFINAPYGYVMFLGDNTNWDTSSDGITIAADDNTYDAVSLGVGSALTGTGVHKLAQTLNRDVGGGDYEYARCVDGAAADTQTVAYAASWTVDSIWIGCDGVDADQQLDNVYIRSITLYPAKLPADLPALTA